MRTFIGYVRMNLIEFEVEDDATDLDVEQGFNQAIQDKFNDGFDSTVDYGYEEIDEEE